MTTILLVLHVLIAVALIGIVLIQRSDSDGFGLGSGSGANLLSGRAKANLLTRTTAILATLFIVNSLVLSVLASGSRETSLVETIAEQESATPSVPVADDKGVSAPEVKSDSNADAEQKAPAKEKAPAKKNVEPNAPTVPEAN
jgi:preprotein translocase subunit SecG